MIAARFFPQDSKMVHLSRMALIEFQATQDWQAQLTGTDSNNLASQVFRPWEFVTHSAQSSHRERSRDVGKRAAREASVRESIHDLKVLDRAPEKAVTGSFRPR